MLKSTSKMEHNIPPADKGRDAFEDEVPEVGWAEALHLPDGVVNHIRRMSPTGILRMLKAFADNAKSYVSSPVFDQLYGLSSQMNATGTEEKHGVVDRSGQSAIDKAIAQSGGVVLQEALRSVGVRWPNRIEYRLAIKRGLEAEIELVDIQRENTMMGRKNVGTVPLPAGIAQMYRNPSDFM